MRKLFASLSLGLLFWAPAQAGEVPDFRATAHTVAVISLLGDDVEAMSGVAVPVPQAGFDEMTERAMARQIRSDLPDATVVLIGGPRAPLLEQMYPAHGFGDLGMKQLRTALQPWAAAHKTDYIVIFRKTMGQAFPRASYKIPFFGIGLTMSDTPIQPNGIAPAALLNITVLDGTTLEIAAELSARDVGWGSMAYSRTDPTPEHLPVLADDIKAMLASMVPGLVHGVGL
jgi:hypothetical protein